MFNLKPILSVDIHENENDEDEDGAAVEITHDNNKQRKLFKPRREHNNSSGSSITLEQQARDNSKTKRMVLSTMRLVKWKEDKTNYLF